MNSWFLAILIIVGMISIDGINRKINRVNRRLERIENRLEQVAKQIGIPEHEVNEELRQLVRDGEKIEAIKKAREVLGLSLLEAKNYIDSL
ncbi:MULTISPECIES: hypothetical protein [Bacillus]|uniref:hypothetical protein n=2 Tax=Bacillaceae TaxID=186817 RepID=UPI0002EA25A7|nr:MULTISPECIES: hypothetical protein [Bacillus]MBY0600351.1 hypothetical protein [Bacillus bingmayongensis]NSW39307.1 hypothetical protein [Bacillus sp. Xin1]NSW39747.1 hypothetical protein [Bacillus sp. Xin1]